MHWRDRKLPVNLPVDWGFVKEKHPLFLTEIGFAGAEERGAHVPVISDESYGDAITIYCDSKDISKAHMMGYK